MATPSNANLERLYDTAFASIHNGKQNKQRNQLQAALDQYMTGIAAFMNIVKIEPNIQKRYLLHHCRRILIDS